MFSTTYPEDSDRYAILTEYKLQEAVIHETKPLTYAEARERCSFLSSKSDVIRVAIVKLEIFEGNESLLPKNE